jgi:ribosomal protein S18 acetylase RimI-like enzyme
MHSDDHPGVKIRPMVQADRSIIAGLIVSVDHFNQAEVDCALELIDIYLNNAQQTDYQVLVAEDSGSHLHAYACWGPIPLTRGAYDLYWIATHPGSRGRGFGHALVASIEDKMMANGGRLLVAETSAKKSYEGTIVFYRRLGFEEASHIKDFYDVGDDRLIFVKRLS